MMGNKTVWHLIKMRVCLSPSNRVTRSEIVEFVMKHSDNSLLKDPWSRTIDMYLSFLRKGKYLIPLYKGVYQISPNFNMGISSHSLRVLYM